jgi:NTP pyrophosphatase (non-canonical NTP hydrolase)
MDLNTYQKEARRSRNNSLTDREFLLNGALGLAGETGEVVDVIKKHLFQGHDLDKTKIVDELGDVMWYIALICDCIGFDLDFVTARNILKLRKRYPDKFSPEQSIDRVDEQVID